MNLMSMTNVHPEALLLAILPVPRVNKLRHQLWIDKHKNSYVELYTNLLTGFGASITFDIKWSNVFTQYLFTDNNIYPLSILTLTWK